MRYLANIIIGLSLLLSGAVSYADTHDADAEAFRDAFLTGNVSWGDVLARAKEEGEVNWYYWGGSNAINAFTSGWLTDHMKGLGIQLNLRHITNTRDAVDLALAEKAVGLSLGQGSVDAIWINGENFYTLGENDLLFGSFADKVPSSENFVWDPSNPASGANLFDFGYKTLAREMPWGSAQFICRINTAFVNPGDAPTTYQELESWLESNPGRFTYVSPPNWEGNTFIQSVAYQLNPDGTGHEPFMNSAQSLGAAEIARLTKPAFEYLKRIEPNLLGGNNPDYPKAPPANMALFGNGETDMYCGFGVGAVDAAIKNGEIPPTAQNHILPVGGLIQNKNFIGITGNAPNPAAALVLANAIGSVDGQLAWMGSTGGISGMDASVLSAENQERVAAATPDTRGVTLADVSANTVPDTNASLVDIFEGTWIDYIQRGDTERSFEQIVADVYAAKYPE